MSIDDSQLLRRGMATLLASWEEYAKGAPGASLRRLPGVSVAVFPNEPERSVYNNALIERELGPADREAALDAMEAAYASAGIAGFAVWVHEGDEAMREALIRRGYTVSESSRAMGMGLDRPPERRPLDLAPPDWDEYLRILGVPPGLLAGADRDSFHVLIGRDGGADAATGMSFDHEGDCGVFNVVTVEAARRRGLGTALTSRLISDGFERGCSTATLQSTPIAEGVYSSVGFRDLGRILEYVR
jgi:GNAT superfamily N-acetyltransferase